MLALPRNYLERHVPTATLILLTFAVPGAHASPVAQTLALGNQRARREPRRLGANPGALGAQSSRRAGHPAARWPFCGAIAPQGKKRHSARRNPFSQTQLAEEFSPLLASSTAYTDRMRQARARGAAAEPWGPGKSHFACSRRARAPS
ncbi:uncharacterized protein SCHCODRAFT_02229453 [Schizophyllum commune H4-8]|uniref:uncharacterized protein n=1 Tax=Schizophyllum commune (strain H4-8 / FGSC 9210) TaxID=578458 RepID=UPI00215E2677|nr:uncharacterized protein SCHCODRAFT_02229453 [Schizophyllum commune H4-8]KAI5895355.1 hypothetical protein SCHCODRAFT_02229453 [Schizophyllum commune H4-8]